MPMNIISGIAQALGPEIIGRLASQLGLDKAQVEKMLRVGAPAILATLGSLVSKPGGAATVNAVIADQEPGILSNLTQLIGGGNSLIESGQGILTSLLGGPVMSALTSVLSRYTGVGEGGTNSLMGFLAPVVMSMLGDQQRKTGLSITDLLSSQASNIASALPRELTGMLAKSGVLDGAMPNLKQGHERVSSFPQTSAYGGKSSAPSTPNSGLGWALPIIAAVALGGFGLWALLVPTETGKVDRSRVEQASVAPEAGPQADEINQLDMLRAVKVGDVDFGAQVSEAMKGMHATLASIKDEASARAAMEPLKNAATRFDDLARRASMLPPDAKRTVANAIAAARPKINQALDRAMEMPGVGPMMKPTIDSIRSGLDTLSTA